MCLKQILIIASMIAIFNISPNSILGQTVDFFDPAANATNVPIDKIINVDFDQLISINNPSANIYFFNADDGFSIIQQYQMSDDEVTLSGQDLLINPGIFFDWPAQTNIVMRIDFDAITGWNGILSHPFQTENDVRPTLTSTSPTIDATGVNIKSDVVLNFSETIVVDPNAYIQIRYDISGATFEAIQFSDPSVTITSNQITITNLTFGFDTDYRVEIGAASALTDVNDNGFYELLPAAADQWTFRTGSATPPQVVSVSPVDGSTDIPLSSQTFTITFNEELQQTGYFLIRDSGGSIFEGFQSGDLTFGTQSISFTPTNSFSTDESYYITFTTVGDLEGSVSQNTTNTFWNFSAIPSTPPNLVSLTPANNSLNIDVRTDLVIKLSEPVFLQDNGAFDVVEIIELVGGAIVETFDLPSARVTGVGTATITINPTNNLTDETKYYIRVLSAFEDDNGTNLDNIHSTGGALDWTFDTGAPPELVSVSPVPNSTDVAVDMDLVMVFNESVSETSIGTPFIAIRRVDNDQAIDFVPFNTGEITGSGTKTLTLNPTNDLPYGTELYVEMNGNVLEDASGDFYSGISDNTTWRFTTENADVTAPSVLSYSPDHNVSNVAIDAELTISFDEPIQHTGSSLSIFIHRKSDGAILASMPMNNGALVDFDGSDLNITLSQNLPNNTEVYVNVPGGAIEDLSGNDFSGITNNSTWVFTVGSTLDITPPTIASLLPLDEATDVALDAEFTLTFDEDVFNIGAGGFIQAKRKSDDQSVAFASIATDVVFDSNEITFSFDTDLPANTALYVNIDSDNIEDATENSFSGISDNETWDFTTQAQPGPELNFGSPADGSTDILVNNNITILYDQSIQKGTGFIRLRRFDNDNLLHSFDVEGAGITVSGTSISVNSSILLTNGLLPETHIYIEVDASAVESLSGTSSVAIVKGDYSFTTGPIEWNGAAWNNGTGPDSTEPARLIGDFDTDEDGNIVANNLTINSGVNVVIANGDHIEVNGDLTHNGASFNVESGGSLVTKGNVSGTNFTFERTTTFDENTGRYSVAGAPVSGADFNALGSSSIVYGYDESQPYNIMGNEGLDRFKTPAELSQSTLQVGVGYFSAKTGDVNGLISFLGTPNNGNQSVSLSMTDHPSNEDAFEGFNLVSNPYPCAIDYSDFIAGNSSDIEGAIYIWDDFDSEISRGTNADYVVINAIGNVDSRQSGLTKWDGHIRSMQGFFVQAKSTGDLQLDFTDAMKVSANNTDGGYYRTANNQLSFKLTLEGSQGVYSETLIGMREEATWNKDQLDARLFSPATNTVYSQILGEAYAIQGIPATSQAKVAIGLKASEYGIYKLSLDEKNNIDGYKIVLHDHLFDKSINLSGGSSYDFSTNSGVTNDRFTITITSEITSIGETIEPDVTIYQDQSGSLIVRSNSSQKTMKAELISLTGQSQKLNLKQLNTNEWQSDQVDQTGFFIVRLITDHSEEVHKIILK